MSFDYLREINRLYKSQGILDKNVGMTGKMKRGCEKKKKC